MHSRQRLELTSIVVQVDIQGGDLARLGEADLVLSQEGMAGTCHIEAAEKERVWEVGEGWQLDQRPGTCLSNETHSNDIC